MKNIFFNYNKEICDNFEDYSWEQQQQKVLSTELLED